MRSTSSSTSSGSLFSIRPLLVDFPKWFDRPKKCKVRLNPNKGPFGVRSGNHFGFTVGSKGSEVDPANVKAMQEMPIPRPEKQARGFLGRLNYIARFIAHMTT